MAIPSTNRAKLSFVDGRFKLLIVGPQGRTVRFPKVEVKSNRIRVGCITVTKEAARKLLGSEEGFVQAEWGDVIADV